MAKAIGAQLVAAHGGDQSRHLTRAAAHQRALECAQSQPVQCAGRDAHHVFGRRAQLVANQVAAIVKADQLAGKRVDQHGL
ncbi:hypothetical protein SDC9_210040 [bioreactor metagenome]|uniref:Uncharacterized protein n=1 Tax=bioreactor metagenome TaxID=1076179 RepID=A0A645JSD8_9ZZZZ